MKISEQEYNKIKIFANNMRKHALLMALNAGENSSHLGAGFSIIDIVATLYGSIMKIDPNNPEWEDRDRFILSKGHGVLGYYSALVESGIIEEEVLKSFEQPDSEFLGHPVKNRKKGIEFTNGSLGMGLSVGIGVALACKKRNKNNRVFVLVGDGECNEGSVWEAAMAASKFKLDNLVAIIDKNGFQLGGECQEVMPVFDMKKCWEGFGWDVSEINGHEIREIYDVLSLTPKKKPHVIIANTCKGKGVLFAENNNTWHHAVLTKSNYDLAMKSLEESV